MQRLKATAIEVSASGSRRWVSARGREARAFTCLRRTRAKAASGSVRCAQGVVAYSGLWPVGACALVRARRRAPGAPARLAPWAAQAACKQGAFVVGALHNQPLELTRNGCALRAPISFWALRAQPLLAAQLYR